MTNYDGRAKLVESLSEAQALVATRQAQLDDYDALLATVEEIKAELTSTKVELKAVRSQLCNANATKRRLCRITSNEQTMLNESRARFVESEARLREMETNYVRQVKQLHERNVDFEIVQESNRKLKEELAMLQQSHAQDRPDEATQTSGGWPYPARMWNGGGGVTPASQPPRLRSFVALRARQGPTRQLTTPPAPVKRSLNSPETFTGPQKKFKTNPDVKPNSPVDRLFGTQRRTM